MRPPAQHHAQHHALCSPLSSAMPCAPLCPATNIPQPVVALLSHARLP